MSLYLVNIRNIEKTTKPFAINIIIHPKYLDNDACKSKKNDSDISLFNETIVVIIESNIIDKKNLDWLMFFI